MHGQLALLALLHLVRAGAPAPPAESADTAALTIVLNLPALRLDAYDGGRLVGRYAVAIGGSRYPTPTGDFVVTQLELNPGWVPPPSPWARDRTAMAPGPRNPMGRAKLLLRELYYIHGTPDTLSIGQAASHGCVRMTNADVLEVASLVLAAGRPELTAAERGRLLADSLRTHRLTLTQPIGVSARYDLLEVMGDSVHAYPDVYGRRTAADDERAQRALELAAGGRSVMPGTAAALLDAARRQPIAVPLDSVMGARTPAAALALTPCTADPYGRG